jgi:hypothetical protein
MAEWCVKCTNVTVEIGETCDECGHVDGSSGVDPRDRIASLESALRRLHRATRDPDNILRSHDVGAALEHAHGVLNIK